MAARAKKGTGTIVAGKAGKAGAAGAGKPAEAARSGVAGTAKPASPAVPGANQPAVARSRGGAAAASPAAPAASQPSATPWGGRFETAPDKAMQAFTASIGFDKRLYKYDVRGSIAHANMLASVGILTKAEARKIEIGLRKIEADIDAGRFVFDIADEDIHMAIERQLTATIGDAGAKLHTARSRNDQVVTDLRLYVKDALTWIDAGLDDLQRALLEVSLRHESAVLPGYTHMQRAQPVLLAHHLLAYYDMLARDRGRIADARNRGDVLVLGAGAIAGTTLPIDREQVARELGFARVADNSMDAVAARDFVIEPLAAMATIFSNLSRLAGEVVLWATSEYGFVRLHDSFSTGSSMMPQKKNPDIAELVRGKSGRVYGNLVAVLTAVKGLPLTYNFDLQEDKEALFDSVDTTVHCLSILSAMVRSLTFEEETMRRAASDPMLLATDLAEILVARGVPFRQAHEVVGKIVRHCLSTGRALTALEPRELTAFSPALSADADRRAGQSVAELLTLDRSVARRTSLGGTSPSLVKKRLRSLAKKHGVAAS